MYSNVLIISANVVNNHQELLYQPREAIWIIHYLVNLTVDSLSFTTSTAAAVLPRVQFSAMVEYFNRFFPG